MVQDVLTLSDGQENARDENDGAVRESSPLGERRDRALESLAGPQRSWEGSLRDDMQ